MSQCQSGDGLSSDGKGLCQRPATKRVEITFKKGVEPTEKVMCQGCAAHWSLVHPTTVKVVGDLEKEPVPHE